MFSSTDSGTVPRQRLHPLPKLPCIYRIWFLSNALASLVTSQLCTAFRKGMLLHETRTSYNFILKIKSLKLKAIRYIGISSTWIFYPFIFKQITHLNCNIKFHNTNVKKLFNIYTLTLKFQQNRSLEKSYILACQHSQNLLLYHVTSN